MIGTKIYQIRGNTHKLFKELHALKFDSLFVSASLCANLEFRELAKINNMNVFVVFPVFYNPEALENHPELYSITNEGEKAVEEWVKFVCPTREDYRTEKIEEIKKILKEHNPNGLSLDFIRYFVFWEKIYQERTLDSIPNCCFCSYCLKKFQLETEITLPEDIRDKQRIATFVKDNYEIEWTNWKCDVIYSLIKEITEEARKIKPDILINIHVIPWRKDDFGGAIKKIGGQDLKKIAKIVDYISPMCYSHMLKREPIWINSVVKDMYEQTKHKIIPSIQVEKCYLETEISTKEFCEMLTEAVKDPSIGVIFWSWEKIQKNFEKKKQLKASLVLS
ncbi:MAG: hypothetical protein ACXADY_14815 [Candidatus Hodarchaeales archaeon]|jgi:hypothetical protein